MSDLISRQEAIGALKMVTSITPSQQDVRDDCIDAIKALPAAQPERKKGLWIYYPKASGSVTSTAVYFLPVCSECGCEHPIANFCPNCGADMRGEQDG